MAALAAVQQGAEKAREPESQTNIPPVMLQEMTWTHGRGEVAASVQKMVNESADVKGNAGTAGSRIARLTSGTLAGEKEFRPLHGPSSKVSRIETPGCSPAATTTRSTPTASPCIPGAAQRTPDPRLDARDLAC